METFTKDQKQKIVAAARKVVEDKKHTQAYLRGEISKQQLEAKGIKLVMPL